MQDQETSRAAYSPGEFAELFGKSQTWGYRQVYAGTVSVLTQRGRILIPASEVDRLLKSAGVYKGSDHLNGSRKRKKLSKRQLSVWEEFVKGRNKKSNSQGAKTEIPRPKRPAWKAEGGFSARQKLANRWAGS